jgi:hypothetical protein
MSDGKKTDAAIGMGGLSDLGAVAGMLGPVAEIVQDMLNEAREMVMFQSWAALSTVARNAREIGDEATEQMAVAELTARMHDAFHPPADEADEEEDAGTKAKA